MSDNKKRKRLEWALQLVGNMLLDLDINEFITEIKRGKETYVIKTNQTNSREKK